MLIDLTQVFHDGMPGVRFKTESGDSVDLTAHISPYMTHEQSGALYDGKASFEITEVAFQTSVGTKMDAPRHRFNRFEEVTAIGLARLNLGGIVVDARHATPRQELCWEHVEFPE